MALSFASGSGGGGSGTVTSVTAADTSIVVAGTAANPTIATGTLDVIAADHPPAAAVALNAKKITGLANGTLATDAAAFGQIPASLPPSGAAGGDLAGTYPNPTVKALTETGGPTDLVLGAIPDGDFLKRSGATIVGAAGGSGTVTSVTAADTSIVVAGTATDPTVRTATLDVIAADHPPAADWSNNSHKITSVHDPTLAQDAATKAYVDAAVPGNAGGKGHLTTATAVNTPSDLAPGADGSILTADSTQTNGLTYAQTAVVNVYAAGSSTWNKPAGCTTVEVVCIGSGGGGGAGFSGTGAANNSGGGGGGGGAVSRAVLQASDVPSSVTVTVATGGSGGTPGNNGGNGANTSFGTLLSAGGGGGGAKGVSGASSNSGGAGSTINSANLNTGGAPVAGSNAIAGQAAAATSNAVGNNSEWGGASGGGGASGVARHNGGSSIFGGPGGGTGCGAGTTTGGTGGVGGSTQSYTAGGGASGGSGGASTTAGGDGTFTGPFCGDGGGGGGSGNTGVTGGNGGAGGLGAGGGGGGSASNGTAGSGGNGGDGRCIVIAHR